MHQYQKIPSKHTCTNDSMSVQRQLINDSLIFWLFYLFFVCICWPNYTVFVCLCQCFANLYFFFRWYFTVQFVVLVITMGWNVYGISIKKKKKRRLWFIYLNICPFFRFVHSCILFDLSCWFFHVTKFFLAQLMIEKKNWIWLNKHQFRWFLLLVIVRTSYRLLNRI